MSRRPRRNHTAVFKAKVALAAIKGEKTLSELAQQFDVHGNQITQWKSQLLEGAIGVFGGEARAESAAATVDRKIGQQVLEIDFLKGCVQRIEEQRMLQASTGNPQSTGRSRKK